MWFSESVHSNQDVQVHVDDYLQSQSLRNTQSETESAIDSETDSETDSDQESKYCMCFIYSTLYL